MWHKNDHIIFFEVQLLFLILCFIFVRANESSTSKQNEELFKKLFKQRRAEHLDAVKSMSKLPRDKQHKMVKTVTKTIFDIILKSSVVLESSGFNPGVSEFPDKEAVRDALSLILENTALMGEVILRLPETAETVLQSNSQWPVLFSWSLAFANQTQLLDNSTTTLIHLVSQELNLIPRNADYVNPYRQVKLKQETEKEPVKKKKKKTEVPRGPRLTLRQSGEL